MSAHQAPTSPAITPIRLSAYPDRKVSNQTGAPHLHWHPVYRLVWIDANGPVPAGH